MTADGVHRTDGVNGRSMRAIEPVPPPNARRRPAQRPSAAGALPNACRHWLPAIDVVRMDDRPPSRVIHRLVRWLTACETFETGRAPIVGSLEVGLAMSSLTIDGCEPTARPILPYRPSATPRGGPSISRTTSPRTSAQRIAAAGHGAVAVVSARTASEVRAGYAVWSVVSKRRASERVASVDRSTSSRLMRGSPVSIAQTSDDGSADAFSAIQRSCCSSRSMRD